MHDKTQHETTCITRRPFIFVKFWRDLRSPNLFYLNHIILQEVQKYTSNLAQILLRPFSKHLWSQNPEYIQRVCKKTSYEETRAEDAEGQFSRPDFSSGCKSRWGCSRLSEACWYALVGFKGILKQGRELGEQLWKRMSPVGCQQDGIESTGVEVNIFMCSWFICCLVVCLCGWLGGNQGSRLVWGSPGVSPWTMVPRDGTPPPTARPSSKYFTTCLFKIFQY